MSSEAPRARLAAKIKEEIATMLSGHPDPDAVASLTDGDTVDGIIDELLADEIRSILAGSEINLNRVIENLGGPTDPTVH